MTDNHDQPRPSKAAGPTVSIGMPVHNGGATVRRALESLLAQTYSDFELIVSDNASTDETEEILTSLSDPRLRRVRHERLIPMVENFQCVLDQARGLYFMWAASDDYWYPEFVETMVSVLDDDPSACVAMSSLELVDAAGSPVEEVRYRNGHEPEALSMYECYRRMLKMTSGPSLHFFIYGLFRTDILRAVMRQPINTVAAGDRVVMSEICLAGRLRSVDTLLHARTLSSEALPDRYPDDPMARSARAPQWRFQYVRGVVMRSVRSKVVPWHVKIGAAPIWVRLGIGQARQTRRERTRG